MAGRARRMYRRREARNGEGVSGMVETRSSAGGDGPIQMEAPPSPSEIEPKFW